MIANFRIRFPEFSNATVYPDARIQLFLDDAEELYMGPDDGRWGAKYDTAKEYLTAHLLAIGTKQAVGDDNARSGPISSNTADGITVTRAVVARNRSDQDSFYMSTSYGLQFLNIRNMCFAGVLTANAL